MHSFGYVCKTNLISQSCNIVKISEQEIGSGESVVAHISILTDRLLRPGKNVVINTHPLRPLDGASYLS